jgi:hypothetical protein
MVDKWIRKSSDGRCTLSDYINVHHPVISFHLKTIRGVFKDTFRRLYSSGVNPEVAYPAGELST